MIFHKFHSIENCRKGVVRSILTHPVSDTKWIVMEKAHGTNINVTMDGENIKFGKRTTFYERESMKSFFRYERFWNKYRQKCADVWNNCKYKTVTIYGELIGGDYPHSKVEKVEIPRIQGGVYYHPGHDFYAFDIRADGEYLPYAKVLFRGSFKDVLNYSAKTKADPTTIPSMFGLEEIEDNVREGNVLKPVVTTYIKSKRVILKDKNDKFSEKKRTCDSEKVLDCPDYVKKNSTTSFKIRDHPTIQ